MPSNVIRVPFRSLKSSRKSARKSPSHSLGEGSDKTFVAPREAAARFLRDMAEVSGYAVTAWSPGQYLSPYATYRPILTAPDPWYFAAIVALEATKICDLFPSEEADETLREVFAQMDVVAGRTDDAVSKLAFMIMGRVGKGTLIMQRKIPDYLLARVMMILVGSPKNAAPHMPDPGAHDQIRAAMKLGRPVWWWMFHRRFTLTDNTPPEEPRLVPSLYTDEALMDEPPADDQLVQAAE